MPKYVHAKHKIDRNRYLYRDEDRPIFGLPDGYSLSIDWVTIESLKSADQIPQRFRKEVEACGFRMYWVPDDAA